ncbi:hypothetical protein [Ancylomarina euxinus]|uniref:hypothetical protein n=1 Tax=Ancylomarina euxinus TaxID=2283627 RepID=UPI001E35F0C0|nr:hypothetical protein [Ancylomarina euxinus]
MFETGKQLFIELANDIYLNHYDLPGIKEGDKVKRQANGQYYLVYKNEDSSYRLKHQLRKTKKQIFPADIPNITYDRLVKGYVKVDSGVSDKTIKNYISFFEGLNSEKIDFPRTSFEMKTVFIAKKPLWDSLPNKNKIPCAYLPNPREENQITEINSIPALQDSLAYFTPKYEVCYEQLLLKDKKVKTIVVFDTETDKIEQIIQDKSRFGFNVIIVSNCFFPTINEAIPCWNWYKEEIKVVNAI